MNFFYRAYCRVFQTAFKIALPLLPYRDPKIIERTADIPAVLQRKGYPLRRLRRRRGEPHHENRRAGVSRIRRGGARLPDRVRRGGAHGLRQSRRRPRRQAEEEPERFEGHSQGEKKDPLAHRDPHDGGHGLANAVILPYVLKAYGKKVEKRLSEIARFCGVDSHAESEEEGARRVVETIERMNEKFSIPERLPFIREEDLDELIGYAYREANPLYPVPELWDKEQLKNIYRQVKGE